MFFITAAYNIDLNQALPICFDKFVNFRFMSLRKLYSNKNLFKK